MATDPGSPPLRETLQRPALRLRLRRAREAREYPPVLTRARVRDGSRAPRWSGRPPGVLAGGPRGAAFSASAGGAQRVVVKVRIVPTRGGGGASAARHLRYLQRDGVARDGSAGQAYTLTGSADVTAWLTRGTDDPHHFRLIVAPERGTDLDLTAFTRDLMRQVEADTGRRLDWLAVDHYNTAHPHSHIVVRGRDVDGVVLRLDRAYLAHGLRERASTLATLELGARSAAEQDRARQQEVTQERFTSLDRWIQTQTRDGQLTLEATPGRLEAQRQQQLVSARLTALTQWGLATPEGPGRWQLADGWAETLRERGTHGDILATMHRSLRGDPHSYHLFDATPSTPATLVGRVVSRDLADELTDREYLLVATTTGQTYHVALAGGQAPEATVGTRVQITHAPRRELTSAATQNLLTYTQTTGGHYDPAQHTAWAQAHVGLAPARLPAYVAAHVQRLERLEGLGLVTRTGPQQWQVPGDLQQRIAALPTPARVPAVQVQVLDTPARDLARSPRVEQAQEIPGLAWRRERALTPERGLER